MLPKSKYLERFGAAMEMATPELIGDNLLVERISDDEFKTASGIVLVSGSQKQVNGFQADRPVFVRILAVGKGYYDPETNESIPLDSRPGDIVLVGQHSVKWFSIFGNLQKYELDTIGLLREETIQLRFKGEAGYNDFFGALNRGAEEAVERKN